MKIIKIINCRDCPFIEENIYSPWGGSTLQQALAHEFSYYRCKYLSTCNTYNKQISKEEIKSFPSWCPLEDYKEES